MLLLKLVTLFSLSLALAAATLAPTPGGIGFSIADVSSYKVVAQHNQSTIYETVVENGADSGYPVHVAVLQGSRYAMGYSYATMSWRGAVANYDALLTSILGKGILQDIERGILDAFLEFQWEHHLSKQVPDRFKEEMRGLSDGGRDAGSHVDIGKLDQRIIVLSNFPSDSSEMIAVLINEFLHRNGVPRGGELYSIISRVVRKIRPHHCSMFAAWGPRTATGSTLSARNLDWDKDTGVNQHKAVIVFRPDDGHLPHAVFGFQGLLGALAGMSERLTVHEANLEEKDAKNPGGDNTFNGFPFVLRLRDVMESAKTAAQGAKVMAATNNTVGFNHQICDANDGAGGSPPAFVFETMAGYTAVFESMDPRENGATWVNPKTNVTEQIGFTLPNALYRTNHGYSEKSRADYAWNLGGGAGGSSLHRYLQIYQGLKAVESAGKKLDIVGAVNITALAGSKGGDNEKCDPTMYHKGSNVLSVTYDPADVTAYISWESGTGASWVPAACATYIKFDLKSFITHGVAPN